VADTGASAVLPPAEERTSQKVAGILTTGKSLSVAQLPFDACSMDATNKKALHRVVWIDGASSPYENVSVSTLKMCLLLHQCRTCSARPVSPCIQLS